MLVEGLSLPDWVNSKWSPVNVGAGDGGSGHQNRPFRRWLKAQRWAWADVGAVELLRWFLLTEPHSFQVSTNYNSELKHPKRNPRMTHLLEVINLSEQSDPGNSFPSLCETPVIGKTTVLREFLSNTFLQIKNPFENITKTMIPLWRKMFTHFAFILGIHSIPEVGAG